MWGNNVASPDCLECICGGTGQLRLQSDDAATDRFRRMWNGHRIRGQRTIRGHGGGIPDELWLDPVEDCVARDDELYGAQQGLIGADGVADDTCTYAVAEPFKGDTVELTEQALPTTDPIEGSDRVAELLRAVRAAYFEAISFEEANGNPIHGETRCRSCSIIGCSEFTNHQGANANHHCKRLQWNIYHTL